MSNNSEIGRIGLFVSSFPPQIDGVSNTAWNYVKYLEKNHEGATVFAPKVSGMKPRRINSPFIQYASINTMKWLGYPFGIPIAPKIVREIDKNNVPLIHMLDPLISAVIGRELSNLYDFPMIVSYNTKLDIDINNLVKNKAAARFAIDSVVNNVSSCDEVWVVSKGAAQSIKNMGYEGDTILMPNGVDMPRRRAFQQEIISVCGSSQIPENMPVLLFVGRMIKEKGIFDLLKALLIMKNDNQEFRMVFIGGGRDYDELKAKAKELGVDNLCLFLDETHSRRKLHAWYSRADLFIFPSLYDTNGLVVQEAAATGTPSLLIRDSSAAENVVDNVNGFLASNSPIDMARRIESIINNCDILTNVGCNAQNDIYLSWKDAVKMAYERYCVVIDNYKSGKYLRKKRKGDTLLKLQADYMKFIARTFP